MHRCERCSAIESRWDKKVCIHCNYPHEEIRSNAQIEGDERLYKRWLRDQGFEDEEESN
jgi:hypothetical protein